MKRFTRYIPLLFLSLAAVFGQSIERATLFRNYGLTEDAKRELILIVTSNPSEADGAKAYYMLGSLAFEESKITQALAAWGTIGTKYPNSHEAGIVSTRIKELAQVVGSSKNVSLDNAIAQSYLEHGNFWSRGRESKFMLDTSWIENVAAAITWYDRVISEFPKTPAAQIAFESKLRAIIGWDEGGRNGEKHGMKADPQVYMPKLLETFAALERDFPDSGSLQAWRYQIAQEYWGMKNWVETRKWLNLIIKESGTADSFYRDLATRRLKKIEY